MKKVLLVNDSKFESMILKDMLVSIGYIAGIADEYDAIERYRTCVLIYYYKPRDERNIW